MSLVSEGVIEKPSDDAVASVRQYIKATMVFIESGLSKPKPRVTVSITSGVSNSKPVDYELVEFVALAQQMATIYKAVFGKPLGE